MPHSLPSLNALRVFEAAARHLSFSRAAEELHVTPAAVSRQIKSLETQLGASLFHRLPRGLALTDAALAGFGQLHKAFCLMELASDQMRGAGDSKLLAVQAAPTFAAKWLLPRLPGFSSTEPQIDLRIAASLEQIDPQAQPVEVRDLFRSGEVSVAIRFGHGLYPGCRVDPLISVSAVPLCSPSLMQGAHPLRNPEDLGHHLLLHDDTPYDGHPQWSRWLALAGVPDLSTRAGLHFNSVQMVLQAAVEGQGVALSLEAMAADDIAAGRLCVPFQVRLPLQAGYYLVSLQETAELPRIRRFRDWLLGEVAKFAAEYPQAGA